jgi:hypothetical protein
MSATKTLSAAAPAYMIVDYLQYCHPDLISLLLELHNGVQLRLHHQLNKGAYGPGNTIGSGWFQGFDLAWSAFTWWRGMRISTLLAHSGIEVERAAKVLR